MGCEVINIYDLFIWVLEVEVKEDVGIQIVLVENKYDLNIVFCKFDRYCGVYNYINIK